MPIQLAGARAPAAGTNQPEEVWINKPPKENELALELRLMQAAYVAAQE